MIASAFPALVLDDLLVLARERDATDLHIAADGRPVMRCNGELAAVDAEPLDEAAIVDFARRVMSADALARIETRGEADGALRTPRLGALRVHAFRAAGRLRLAIRLLRPTVPTVEALRLPSVVRALAERRSGLLFFVGPTGSGKTTSLAAVVDYINRTSSRHIVTIEDPVEYVHTPVRSVISQREIERDTPDFATAVRGALRANPDVMLIGELRDGPTIAAALTAADTGHLVLATLHTADATGTIDRIVDAFSGSAQRDVRAKLAQSLLAVVSQRLLRGRIVGKRHAAFEILIATDAVRNLIREGKSHQIRNAIQTGRAAGMQTLEDHLSDLVVRGEVSLESARAIAERPDNVRTLASADP